MISDLSRPVSPGAADIERRICVSEPYYALQGLTCDDPGTVMARVPVQAPLGRQASAMGIAEVGRHLAILGSCAAASLNPSDGRHFYLARSATGGWSGPATVPGAAEPGDRLLAARATAHLARRTARAHSEILDSDGRAVATADIEYDIMSQAVFQRLFGTGPLPGSQPTTPVNPYANALPLRDIKDDGTKLTAALTIDPELCPGHFDGYSALPVAIACAAITTLADRLQEHTPAGGGRWLASHFAMQARRLAAAGTTVTVTVRPALADLTAHAFEGTVRHDDETIAQLRIDYRPTP